MTRAFDKAEIPAMAADWVYGSLDYDASYGDVLTSHIESTAAEARVEASNAD